ncbi:MAG: hypothetical protein LUF25_04985 [Phascolarctobacterium sp.]|nr:hypothetical protein [Phascolarctobacterium sp.]
MEDRKKYVDPNDPMRKEVEYRFWKRSPENKIWGVSEVIDSDRMPGRILISFDKKKFYNIYGDYPAKMSEEERKIFEKEYPDWVAWLNGRK